MGLERIGKDYRIMVNQESNLQLQNTLYRILSVEDKIYVLSPGGVLIFEKEVFI